jgi:carbon-monoxide dehydrogenase small subunit
MSKRSESLSRVSVHMTVNGKKIAREIAPHRTLLEFLREDLHLTGTKEGCGQGDCGTCTVQMDGRPVNSCLMLAVAADGCEIVTIEGVADAGVLHPIQQQFLDKGAVQCGFCSPGMILSSKSLLDANPNPTEQEVKRALSGNLCRCGNYKKIIDAVLTASKHSEESPR